MATRQYIGARYVPKFYENSAGTSEWRSGVIYEPLTIVTWNGNSYTSKKVVPAAIGDPSSNPAYWVATGVFNEQLASIQTELAQAVSDIEDIREEIKYQDIVLLTDSYGVSGVTGGTSWMEYVQNDMADKNIETHAWGGAGFGRLASETEYYFPTLFRSLEGSAETDLVMLLAGANDGNLLYLNRCTRADIASGLTEGIAVLKTKFPNAKIMIGFVGRFKNSDRTDEYAAAAKEYMKNYNLGYKYILNSQYCLYDRSLIGDSDIHPTLAGSRALADMAELVINGGTFDYTFDFESTYLNIITRIHVHNDIATFTLNRDFDATTKSVGLTVNQDMTPYGNPIVIANWFIPEFCPSEKDSGFCAILPVGYTDANDVTHTGAFMFRANKYRGLVIQALALNGGLTAQYVKLIILPQLFSIQIPTLYS